MDIRTYAHAHMDMQHTHLHQQCTPHKRGVRHETVVRGLLIGAVDEVAFWQIWENFLVLEFGLAQQNKLFMLF